MAAATSPITLWDTSTGNFCPVCGSMLVFPNSGDVKCDSCPFSQSMESLPQEAIETRSFPKPVQEWLVEWRVLRAARRGNISKEDLEAGMLAAKGKAKAKRAVIDEECPKCKAPNMEYYAVQQRSADEGETVYYICTKCDHQFSVNN